MGSGASEGCRAFGYGFAGCYDVVDEEDCFCVEGLFARHGEGAYDVGGARFFVCEAALHPGGPDALQGFVEYCVGECGQYFAGEEVGLVESAVPEPNFVERDGYDGVVGFAFHFLVRECGHAFAEGPGEAGLPVKFEEADGLGDGAVEAGWRIDAGVCGRLVFSAGGAGEVSGLAESYLALVGLPALDAKGAFDGGG